MSVKIIVDSASDVGFSFAKANNIGFAPLKTNLDELKIGQLGCVIGTHTGPGAIVVSFVSAG